jgi:hypothetical protein
MLVGWNLIAGFEELRYNQALYEWNQGIFADR